MTKSCHLNNLMKLEMSCIPDLKRITELSSMLLSYTLMVLCTSEVTPLCDIRHFTSLSWHWAMSLSEWQPLWDSVGAWHFPSTPSYMLLKVFTSVFKSRDFQALPSYVSHVQLWGSFCAQCSCSVSAVRLRLTCLCCIFTQAQLQLQQGAHLLPILSSVTSHTVSSETW